MLPDGLAPEPLNFDGFAVLKICRGGAPFPCSPAGLQPHLLSVPLPDLPEKHTYPRRTFPGNAGQIQALARFALRKEWPACRQELIAKVIANCWVAFERLGSPMARAKVTLLLEGTADGQ